MHGQAEPAFAVGLFRFPVAEVRVAGFEVAIGNRLVGVFETVLRNGQALFRYPRLALFTVTLIEVLKVRVLGPPHFIAYDQG